MAFEKRSNGSVPFATAGGPSTRQAVILRALLVFGELPFRVEPSLFLETMERRIQRAVIDIQHVVRRRADRHLDAVAVLRPPLQRAKDEQVEGALQKILGLAVPGFAHGRSQSTTIGSRMSTTLAVGRRDLALSGVSGRDFAWDAVGTPTGALNRMGHR